MARAADIEVWEDRIERGGAVHGPVTVFTVWRRRDNRWNRLGWSYHRQGVSDLIAAATGAI